MLRLRRTPEQSSPVIESGLSVVWKGTINSTETGKVNVQALDVIHRVNKILSGSRINYLIKFNIRV